MSPMKKKTGGVGKKGASKASADGLPPIDDSLTLDKAVGAIATLEDSLDDTTWWIGAYYWAISDRGFPLPKPYLHPADYVQHMMKKPVTARMLEIYAAVSRQWLEPIALAYGMAKLGELITWGKATGTPLPADPGDLQIQFVGRDGQTRTKAFRDCSEGEMIAALNRHHAVEAPKGLVAAVKNWNQKFAGECKFEIEQHPDHVTLALRNINCDNKGEVQNVVNEFVPELSGTDDWADDDSHGRRPRKKR